MDPDTIKHIWALQKVNQLLLVGLEAAVHAMEDWDQLPEERRKTIKAQLNQLVRNGKDACSNVLDTGLYNGEAVKH